MFLLESLGGQAQDSYKVCGNEFIMYHRWCGLVTQHEIKKAVWWMSPFNLVCCVYTSRIYLESWNWDPVMVGPRSNGLLVTGLQTLIILNSNKISFPSLRHNQEPNKCQEMSYTRHSGHKWIKYSLLLEGAPKSSRLWFGASSRLLSSFLDLLKVTSSPSVPLVLSFPAVFWLNPIHIVLSFVLTWK